MLPFELWTLVDSHMRTCDKWSLLGVCRTARAAVVSAVEAPGGSAVFNREQAAAFVRVAILGQSIWLTGKAGTGKSHVTRAVALAVAERCGAAAVAICAPTGTAARVASVGALRGATLHMAFNVRSRRRAPGDPAVQLGGEGGGEDSIEAVHARETGECVEGSDADGDLGGVPTCVLDGATRRRLQATQLLIVDEASMASSEMIDLVDSALRRANGRSAPFGGVVVMAIADFLQLDPVVSPAAVARAGGKKWAFEAAAWAHLRPVQLALVVRQKDPQFAAVLNRMRVGQTTDQDVEWLKRAGRTRGDAELAIFPSNKKCKRRNDQVLRAIDAPLVAIEAVYETRRLWRGGDAGAQGGVPRPLPPQHLRRPVRIRQSARNLERAAGDSRPRSHPRGRPRGGGAVGRARRA
jgi:hypothetical protein